jgi:hypothetical protein
MSTAHKPLDSNAAETLLNLTAVHGLAEVLDFLSDHYQSLPEGFEKPMTSCVKVADALHTLVNDARDADDEVDAG